MTRVLVIEDSNDLAQGLRYNLELEGYAVKVADDGNAGLSLAREWDPDLVILDLMLPGIDGYQVLRSLRTEGCQTPVLILSARGEEADKVRGFQLDADQYVTKPFGLIELLERVKSLLRRNRARTDAHDTSTNPGVIRFGDVTIASATSGTVNDTRAIGAPTLRIVERPTSRSMSVASPGAAGGPATMALGEPLNATGCCAWGVATRITMM